MDLFLAQAVGLSPPQKGYSCHEEAGPKGKSHGETTPGCCWEKEGVLDLASLLTFTGNSIRLNEHCQALVSTSFREQLILVVFFWLHCQTIYYVYE